MAQCQSGRHYGIPGYKQWADELWRRYRNGEPLSDGAGAGTATDAGLATLQDTHGKEVETVLKGVSTDDPEEDVAGVRSFHILSVLRFLVNTEYSVYYCEDNAWGGACKHVLSPLGSDPEKCTTIDGRASSIGPDPGYYCIFYTNALCAPIASDGSDSLTLTYPGTDNLSATQKGNFNDRLLSYNCFKEEEFSLEPPELGTPPNIVDGGKTQ
ncbi:hypothetical protein SLS59_005763 [Nothophoma quercina]|uniref:Uncharacterized protein n=1 Tax=Nothophoma quercina TaxID=749835 RepID=A0ABR3RA35_9PLEO